MVRVSRGSNKKKFVIKIFRLCDIKTQQTNILKEQMSIYGKETVVLLDILRDFLKSYEHQIHTDFSTETQNWNWVDIVKRQPLWSLL